MAPGWSCRGSCGPTRCRAHRPPWLTSWDCATWPSRSATCRRLSIGQLPRATDWSVASASTRAPGGWPTSGGRKGSSSHWPSASAEPCNARICNWERGSVTCCWSAHCSARAAVEPECPGLYRADPEQPGHRPGICGKACPYVVLICCLDGMQGLLAVANWAAQDEKAVVDEPVHERRVPGPAVLVPDLTRGVPARAVDQPHREMRHGRSVRAITDIPG